MDFLHPLPSEEGEGDFSIHALVDLLQTTLQVEEPRFSDALLIAAQMNKGLHTIENNVNLIYLLIYKAKQRDNPNFLGNTFYRLKSAHVPGFVLFLSTLQPLYSKDFHCC